MSRKAHRNGIKKPKTHRYPSTRGWFPRLTTMFRSTLCLRISSMSNEQVDPKFMRNQRYAKHGSERALREARAAAQSA
ncbi:hypothetical protein MGL_0229 [Malassezia globosa CBS 7966]|uniref:60S ribosomal protein L29 n=1 Tax=Malassezia globosa (strain ATCC MYA-4612 / CBS 7966) TaxID=425265 RepID=A8PSB8_MALGO|nr:uncharacterized protein MGL_0229 [Malassezia globosa CBS 7966]EDP45240.1 hypothetical protein MGL_0229 [Malassezia globosa CBS 7966]